MFERIEESELEKNKKYKIFGNDIYSGIFKGIYWHDHLYFLEFEKVRNLSCGKYEPRYILPNRHFYKFVSQKERIQSDMEHRAVNQIIRRVLGDDHFSW